jgi:hypothetical protein
LRLSTNGRDGKKVLTGGTTGGNASQSRHYEERRCGKAEDEKEYEWK